MNGINCIKGSVLEQRLRDYQIGNFKCRPGTSLMTCHTSTIT